MAGNIKGITIEIDGKTNGIDKAFKNINKAAASTQREIKGVSSLLKMNPGNTDLIAQKQKLLGDQVSVTKKKIEDLKTAQDALKSQGVDNSSAEFRNLQREIVSTENKLKSLKNEQVKFAAETSKVGIFSSKMTSFGEKTYSVGAKAKYASVAMIGLGAASIAAFKEVDNGADAAISATGLTGAAARQLEGSYKKVATSVVGDFSSIGAALGEVNTRFSFTGKTLEIATTDFAKFSKVTGVDAKESVSLIARAMGDAGIQAKDYRQLLDQVTAASQASGISAAVLTEQITKYGAPMRNLGFSLKESIALFSTWEKAGVNTEIAFSGMKKAIGNWTKQGKDASVEFKSFVQGIKTGSISSAEAIEVFGQKAGPDLIDAIKGGRFEYEKMLDVVNGSKGALGNSYNEIIDGADEAEIALKQAKVAAASVGETLIKMLAPTLKKVASNVEAFGKWWDKAGEGTKKFIITTGGFIAIAGPTLMAVGKLSQGLGALGKAYSVLKAGQTASSAAIEGNGNALTKLFNIARANPIASITLGAAVGVGALTYAVYKAATAENQYYSSYAKNKMAREESVSGTLAQATSAQLYLNKIKELEGVENKSIAQKAQMKSYVEQLNSIYPGLNAQYDAEKDKIIGGTAALQQRIEKMKEATLASAYQKQMESAAEEYVKNQKKLADAEATFNSARIQGYKTAYEEAVKTGNVTNVTLENYRKYTEAKGQVDGLTQSLVDGQLEMESWGAKAMGATALTSQAFLLIENSCKNAGITIPEAIKTGIQNGAYQIPTSVAEMEALINFEGMKSKAAAAGVEIPQNIVQGLATGKLLPSQAMAELSSLTTSAASVGGNQAGSTFSAATASGIANGAGAAKIAGEKVKQAAKDGTKGTQEFSSVGEQIASGVAGGMNTSEALKKVTSAAKNVIKQALAAAKKEAEVRSPSRKFDREVGRQLPAGTANGILNNLNMVKSASKRLITAAMPSEKIDIGMAIGDSIKQIPSTLAGVQADYTISIVDAIDKRLENMTIEVDGRAFGRLVRRSV